MKLSPANGTGHEKDAREQLKQNEITKTKI